MLINQNFLFEFSNYVDAGSDGLVRLFDPADGTFQRKLEGHDGEVLSVAFAPDGRSLASGGSDGCVLVHDLTGAP